MQTLVASASGSGLKSAVRGKHTSLQENLGVVLASAAPWRLARARALPCLREPPRRRRRQDDAKIFFLGTLPPTPHEPKKPRDSRALGPRSRGGAGSRLQSSPMPARSIGTATISFGLVSIPAKLYTTNESSGDISFNMLHEADGARLKQQYICTKCNEVVDREHTVKGYEHAKGQYVIFSAEEPQEPRCGRDADDRARGVRAGVRGRSAVRREELLPRARQGRRARLQAARRGHGRHRARRRRVVLGARQGVHRAAPPVPPGLDHAPAALQRRGQAVDGGADSGPPGHQARRGSASRSRSSSRSRRRRSSPTSTRTTSRPRCST